MKEKSNFKETLNLLYKIIFVFFLISHFHDTNFDDNKLGTFSYFFLLILLALDLIIMTIKMFKKST